MPMPGIGESVVAGSLALPDGPETRALAAFCALR
jgi:hypothetical protein